MLLTLSILDETTAGERQSAGAFHFDRAALTLRDIIRLRVQQEVERFNQSDIEVFRGLVRPEETERILNSVREFRPILDPDKQCAKAIRAFEGNGFLVFVDDCQIASLDEPVELTAQTQLSFLKLVPLIGG